MPDYSKEFLELLQSVTAKRPKTVIEHILKYGFITSEELKTVYGYNHPPRAVRDVREHGIAIETYRVSGSDGRKIAAYKFGDPTKIRFSKLSGRTALSKTIKDKLISTYGCKCFIYQEVMDERDLQIDHRIPFEVDGDGNNDMNPEDFMLLSGSANRAKSWSCEQCENWNNKKDKAVCLSCYWAYPENYSHIAMLPIKRVDLIWQGEDVEQYELLKKHALSAQQNIPDFIKGIIENELKKCK
ncbi:MAG: HNH nuclease [Methylococcaceae bacterium NSP1-2]|nr:helix-turn-helix domain-containing protein [Methylococcaceae bacterium]OYV21266.1 MAG: HNH nuclease [Methylococcaceae bacterium NSP1-2]